MAAGSASVAATRGHNRARSFVPSVDEKKYYYHARVMRRAQKAANSSWQVAAAAAAGAVQMQLYSTFAERCYHLEWCAAVAQYSASQFHERLSVIESRLREAGEESEVHDAPVPELPVRQATEKDAVTSGKHMESLAEPVAEQPPDVVSERGGHDVSDTPPALLVAEVATPPAPQSASEDAEPVVVPLVEQCDGSEAAEQVVVSLVEQCDGSLAASPPVGPATASDEVGFKVDADEQPVVRRLGIVPAAAAAVQPKMLRVQATWRGYRVRLALRHLDSADGRLDVLPCASARLVFVSNFLLPVLRMSEEGLRGKEQVGVLGRLWAQTHRELESLSIPWEDDYPLHESLYDAVNWVYSTRGLLGLRARDLTGDVHDAYTQALSGILSPANLHRKWLMRVHGYSEEQADRMVEEAYSRSIKARRAAVARSSWSS